MTNKDVLEIAAANREQILTELPGMVPEIAQAVYDSTVIQSTDGLQGLLFDAAIPSMSDALVGLEINGKIRAVAIGVIAGIRTLRALKQKEGGGHVEAGWQNSGGASKTAVRAGKGASEGK